MRSFFPVFRIWTILLLVCPAMMLKAQSNTPSYKSLLWEISGNGLTKPSYLFGTMHISNKMVFHLSDSFYMGIRNTDVVAIELNPEQWQSEIPRITKQGNLMKYYNAVYYTDYLKEQSFTEDDFLAQLQESLRFEPELNDALLYRNESRLDNFQEDTYLDLYIYQTGKKLGKMTAGVETYIGSQRMMIEAMVDAALEKDKKRPGLEGVQYYELNQVMQDAYRKGDLDMLDSINKLTEYGQSFTEKFLYKRNEIQAASMDSIMQHHSLFVGVGAAHLPGKRGVIEILRKKGYTLRPVYMQDRDATQKKYIDSLSVPVHFATQYATDSFYSVSAPGKLNDVESRNMTLKHYADMGNGSYYLVTRIRTNSLFNGYSGQRIQKMIDSLLYENIPGTILVNKQISKNGYSGIDIINKTRKGDMQHYQLWVTPAEMLVFKMGGKGNYVTGPEADTFFNSITFRERKPGSGWQSFSPATGGFTIKMPVTPYTFYSSEGSDRLPEWKYEAQDPLTGDQYAVFKKSIYSFDFIEADTFDLTLITESFGSSKYWEKKRTIRTTTQDGRPVKDIYLTAKDGDIIHARAVIMGPQYYLLVHRSRNKTANNQDFFNSFVFSPFRYPAATRYTDTSWHFTVNTPIQPVFDADVMDMMLYARRSEPLFKKQERYYRDGPDNRSANFVSETTGEVIIVNNLEYPDYYYIKDSVQFWNRQFYPDSTLVLHRKTPVSREGGVRGWLLEWSDTASTRLIRKLVLSKGMQMVTASTVVDSTLAQSVFLNDFYNTLNICNAGDGPGLFTPKQERFFRDYYSKDTVVSKRARLALSYLYYGKEGYPAIKEAIGKLQPKDPDYFELKSKFISELGYIRDSAVTDDITAYLKQVYLDAGDTTVFQNNVLRSLSRLRTVKATHLFKELILQDPPAFEEQYAYDDLFSAYDDSLRLAAGLYPELLNLSTIEDFKTPVRTLLASLVDSNYIRPDIYDDYLGNIYFDAKVALKKLRNADEHTFGQQDDDEDSDNYSRQQAYRSGSGGAARAGMNTYITLLAPAYDKNPNLPKFFEKLLASGDLQVKLNTALAMLRYKHPLPDSIWDGLASANATRAEVWSRLKEAGYPGLFPKKYQTGEAMAASRIYASLDKRLDTLVLMQKRPAVQKEPGMNIYIYKYKLKKEDDWRLAFSSAKEEKNRPAESTYTYYYMAPGRLPQAPAEIATYIDEKLKKMVISKHNGGRQFYSDTYSNDYAIPAPVED